MQTTGFSYTSSVLLSRELFGFIVFAILKPAVEVLNLDALAGPAWGEVLGDRHGQFFPLRLTSQWVCLATQQKHMPGMFGISSAENGWYWHS